MATPNRLTPMLAAGILFVLFIMVCWVMWYSTLHKYGFYRPQSNAISYTVHATPAPTADDVVIRPICPQQVPLSKGFSYQEPLNSFFGITFKDGQGRICSVILSPSYSSKSFDGQIQINSYVSSLVSAQSLLTEDQGTKDESSVGTLRYTRPSYGGDDDVLVLETQTATLQIIWRGNNQTEQEALRISKQLQ